jgi:hypothetical protein
LEKWSRFGPNLAELSPNDFQPRLRRRLFKSGEFYIVPFNRDGVGALRVTIINPLTMAHRLDHLMDTLRRFGREPFQMGAFFRAARRTGWPDELRVRGRDRSPPWPVAG